MTKSCLAATLTAPRGLARARSQGKSTQYPHRLCPTSARPKSVEFWMGHLPTWTGHPPIPFRGRIVPIASTTNCAETRSKTPSASHLSAQFCARLSGGRSSSGRTSGPCGRSGRAKILGASRPRKGPSGRTPESESRKPAAVPRRPCLEPRPLHSLSRACWLRGRLLQALRHDGRQCPEADFNIQVNSGYHGPCEYPVSEASSTPAATWALGGVVRGFLDNRRRHAGREQGPEIGDS